jgi:hypothetical protein
MRTILTAFVCVGFALATGCESTTEGGRREVTGSVTFNGQPVEEGQIVFEPEAPGARMATGQIKGGKYHIEPKFGPSDGSYLVRIDGYRKKKVGNMLPNPNARGSDTDVVSEQYLPAEYNTRTTLRIDIAADGENVHDFELKTGR